MVMNRLILITMMVFLSGSAQADLATAHSNLVSCYASRVATGFHGNADPLLNNAFKLSTDKMCLPVVQAYTRECVSMHISWDSCGELVIHIAQGVLSAPH